MVSKFMGVDWPEWINFDEAQSDVLLNAKANAMRVSFYPDDWIANIADWTDPTNASKNIQPKHLQIKTWLQQRSIRYILNATALTYNPPEGYVQHKADVIMNKNGMGDLWISQYADAITKLQPYAFQVMNEPHTVANTTYASTMTQEQFFEAYRQFAIRVINAWRAIKPDMVAVVSSCPFYDMKPIASNPIPLPNIVYAFHRHYSYNNLIGDEPSDIAYWNATTPDELASAKAVLYNEFLNPNVWGPGLQLILNAGLDLCFIECGAGNEANNAAVWMQDVYDFCRDRNFGILHHQLRPYPRYPQGILQESTNSAPSGIWRRPLTLNAMGEIWQRNMSGAVFRTLNVSSNIVGVPFTVMKV